MPRTDLLDPDKIKANLKTRLIGRKILVYRSTSSTNDIAAEYARNKKNDGLVIFAEEQTAGRGRSGSKWLSGRSDSILCSVVLTDCKCSSELLSLASAVAAAEAIGKVAESEARIKWPNDIRLNDKKVAGILLASRKGQTGIVYIVGIGINCHQKADSFPVPSAIASHWERGC
ncbi:MAG: biotin--[acetyl-CoA-carboxylase] ligase [Planctomycetota bacterium]|jgi:BirA family biotin operon repressor/biotin-[acetyl-CoA-carboxylase] ligase